MVKPFMLRLAWLVFGSVVAAGIAGADDRPSKAFSARINNTYFEIPIISGINLTLKDATSDIEAKNWSEKGIKRDIGLFKIRIRLQDFCNAMNEDNIKICRLLNFSTNKSVFDVSLNDATNKLFIYELLGVDTAQYMRENQPIEPNRNFIVINSGGRAFDCGPTENSSQLSFCYLYILTSDRILATLRLPSAAILTVPDQEAYKEAFIDLIEHFQGE